MKKLKSMLIAGLILVVLCQTAVLVDLTKKYKAANNDAAKMSDIIRMHLDDEQKECWFNDMYCDYVEDFGPLNLDEYVHCY